jgi:NAD-dependent deacetylase
MNAQLIQEAARLLRRARHTVALTGAGISTPSGIPDFRSPESGLWQQADPMVVASLHAFRQNPLAFYEWVKPLVGSLRAARPNPAHLALAQLESLGLLSTIITQNIDMLHTRAGSQHVLEVHGHLREATCLCCCRVLPAAALLDGWLERGELPRCPDCGNTLKPNVILFGEQLPAQIFLEASQAARRCDLMIVAGSSLEVFPVAELPCLAADGGARLIIVNREPTCMDARAAVVIRDDVALALPAVVEEVLHDAR